MKKLLINSTYMLKGSKREALSIKKWLLVLDNVLSYQPIGLGSPIIIKA